MPVTVANLPFLSPLRNCWSLSVTVSIARSSTRAAKSVNAGSARADCATAAANNRQVTLHGRGEADSDGSARDPMQDLRRASFMVPSQSDCAVARWYCNAYPATTSSPPEWWLLALDQNCAALQHQV